MYHYRLYCTDIISDVEFIQLVKGTGVLKDPETAITVRAGHFPDELRPDEECYSVIRDRESYLTNHVCLLYIRDNNTIEYELRPNADSSLLPNYILGWGMSMLFMQRGRAVIHCSALYNDKGAYLLSGLSGSGKSTMTTYLLDKGLSFMADDTSASLLGEKEAYATPCFPFRKLCRDMVKARNLNEEELIYIDEDKDKFLVPYEADFPDEPRKINALIFLVPGSNSENCTAVEAKEIKGLAKVEVIKHAMFLFPLFKANNNNAFLFQKCLDLAGRIPVYMITRPDEGDTREQVFNEIEKIISKYN